MNEAGGDLAGYGSRVGATLLDGLLVGVVAFLAVVVAGVTRGDVNYVVIALALLSSLVYAPVLMCRSGSHNGQTLGKQALAIRVVRQDAQPITASTALVREFVGKGVLGLVPFFTIVDYLFPLGDPRRQAIHDKLASTFVVGADAVPDLARADADPFGARASDEPPPPSGAWAPPAPASSSGWAPPVERSPAPPVPEAEEPSPGTDFAPPSAPAPPPPSAPSPPPRREDDDEVRGPFGPRSND